MKILAIETSCDETACAIVENGRKVLSNLIHSQIKVHAKTGGVVPEVAAREHVLKIAPIVKRALIEAKLDIKNVDAIAVTCEPGLVSSLVIGVQAANTLSLLFEKPIISVNHIDGHIYSTWLEQKDEVVFPILVLSVSGGHNELFIFEDHGKIKMLGETLDDACGEAFDKVAKMLGMGYPGGAEVAKMALLGNKNAFDFPRVLLGKNSFDFSFSGLKTAVLQKIKGKKLSKKFVADVCASFQDCVTDILCEKVLRAVHKYPQVKEVHLVGGVSANVELRRKIKAAADQNSLNFRHPLRLAYCTDNAAMIAAAAYYKLRGKDLKFNQRLSKMSL